MTFASPPLAAPRARAAAPLWHAAAVVLALMPLGMVAAHRSSPAFLGLAAILALLALAREGDLGAFQGRAVAALRTPLGLAALALAGWGLVSSGWSAFPALSLRALGEFWLPVLSAFILALALPGRVPRSIPWLLAGAAALACLVIVIELRTGLAFRRQVGLRDAAFIFNRPVLTVLVLLAPLMLWLGRRGVPGWSAAAVLAVSFALALLRSESGAAKLGLLAGLGTFLIAWAAPRLALRAAMAAVVLVFAVAPVLGPVTDRLIPASVHTRLKDAHSRDRIDIWLSFNAAIREQPLLGGGFGVSPRMRETPVASQVPTDRRTLLAVGHPHNAAVQVWAELGLVGAVLAGAVLLLVLRGLGGLPRLEAAAALALVGAAGAVALVGHGAWQGWWPAGIGAAVVWFRAIRQPPDGASATCFARVRPSSEETLP
ncbi:MAG TPA: O-antigen ligase family protein [Microvirga sp.]|jgi:hypothetical protein